MAPPQLLLGPLLRHVGETDATVWVETDRPCEVEVLGCTARTFTVAGHHYALVVIEGLQPDGMHRYEVALDGATAWPEPNAGGPPSIIRTLGGDDPLRIAFGSCRVAAPHAAPWSLTKDEHDDGREIDALLALAVQMRDSPPEEWPGLLVLLGDQVYADQVSPATVRFIESREVDRRGAPVNEVADYEEYCHLYWEAWRPPLVRWLLSTVPSTMIFDDHDVHDDWNTSAAWVRDIRKKPWWRERIIGAYSSYWVYQHIGNLSPRALREDEVFPQVMAAADDATQLLRGFASRAEVETRASRWSFCRDLGASRLVVIDSRAGRVLEPGRRDMLDPEEWEWLDRELTGDVDHLIVGTSLPLLLAPGMHHLEAWNEAVCEGAWGRLAAHVGESIRQALDLEHWAAFRRSFERLTAVLTEVASGRRGTPPASIVVLSGDVHHAYVADAELPGANGTAVAQVTCSPFRNPLSAHERRVVKLAQSRPATALARVLARSAGVPTPAIRWDMSDGPWFDNQLGMLTIDGPRLDVSLAKAPPGDPSSPQLEQMLERNLTRG